MLENSYLDGLKKCITIRDVENTFKDQKFNNKGESCFFDNSIALVGSGNVLTNAVVKVDGFSGLLFRLTVFLKLAGNLGSKPQNSGEVTYFNQLQSFYIDISNIKNIETIDDIDSNLIDEYIKLQFEKGNKAKTTYTKLGFVTEITHFADKLELPYLLNFDDNLLKNSIEYKKLKKQRTKEAQEASLLANAKQPYPLEKLKVIISESIEFIEKYSYEILEISKLYMSSKGGYANKIYIESYEYFKRTEIDFTEPRLKEIQDKVQSSKHKYKNYKSKNLGRNPEISNAPKIMLDTIWELEVSCVSIVLMLTGMRVGELCTLNRNLKITQDEHYNLERIVYKTASSEDGESLEMPIPSICKKALEVLSELSKIKDSENNSSIILSPIEQSNIKPVRTSRINQMLIRYCEKLGLDKVIAPHQFRHAMAFLIVHIHESEGLELARMFLGHSSIVMTLQYMGNFNNEIKDAIWELQQEESEQLVGAITEQIQNNKKLFGENGKRLMPNHRFAGQQVDEFVKLVRKGLMNLIEEQKLAIIQTPVSLCIHDLSKPEDLACQREFNITEIVANGPAPSRCKGANCANALFFEEHIEKLKNDTYAEIDPALKERLEQNTYFMEAGGLDQDPFRRIIKEYDKSKEETA